jgi:hypothetical protein
LQFLAAVDGLNPSAQNFEVDLEQHTRRRSAGSHAAKESAGPASDPVVRRTAPRSQPARVRAHGHDHGARCRRVDEADRICGARAWAKVFIGFGDLAIRSSADAKTGLGRGLGSESKKVLDPLSTRPRGVPYPDRHALRVMLSARPTAAPNGCRCLARGARGSGAARSGNLWARPARVCCCGWGLTARLPSMSARTTRWR